MNSVRPASEAPGHLVFPHPRLSGEFRDWRGRRYLVGASARELTGRDRSAVLAGTVPALLAVGVLQYGYGSVVPVLTAAHGLSTAQALTPLLVWALFQGGSAVPVAHLRERGALAPGRAVVLGAALCAVALATLGHADGLGALLLGYGVLGGAGAGLVYHSCVHLAAAWYPERPTARTGLAGGAFALGAAPVVVAATVGLRPDDLAAACTVAAIVVGGVTALCGRRLPEPPRHWWPPHPDPRAWALDRRVNPALAANPAAAGEHSPAQAWRSGALPAMNAVLALAGAVSLFNIACLPVFLHAWGASPAAVAAAVATLVATNGAGRVAADRASERLGRRRTLGAVLALSGIAQFGLAAGGASGAVPLLLCCAALAGVGGGACYPLTSALAVDYFGVRDAGRNQGFVYSAKALGGLLGIGGAAVLLALAPTNGHVAAFCAAGLLALAAAALTLRLHRPINIRTIPG